MKNIKLLALTILCYLLGCYSCSGNKGDRPPGELGDLPNIIFLLTDDLGYGDLQCYNTDSKIPTPNLDQLAAGGMRFTDAHTPSSVCSPTRYAVLTGRYAWRTERLKTGVLSDEDPPIIEEERLTVADMLKEQGYRTAAFGKWHLGNSWHLKDPSGPNSIDNIDWSMPMVSGALQQGFEYAFQLALPGWTFVENDSILEAPTESFDLTHLGVRDMGPHNIKGFGYPGYKHEHMLPAWTDKTVKYIRESAGKDEPFFIYWAPICPHLPLSPNKEFLGSSGAGLYGDFVVELDASVGAIINTLKETGQLKNTLIIFTSDNGPERWAYERTQETGHFSMGDWRGLKRDVWEGGHRVPFIAHWPERVNAGSVSNELVSLVDFMATAAAITGYELPAEAAEDSYDVLPALTGKDLKAPIRESAIYHASNGVLALRQGDWIYIDGPSGGVSPEPAWFREERGVIEHDENAELYKITEDPTQTTNLYSEFPDKAEALKALLAQYRMEGRSR